jgi:uncharacterized protein (DUF927 family)
MSASELKRRIPDVARVARDLYSINFQSGVARCPFWEKHNHGDRAPSLRFDKRKNRIFCASQQCFGEKGVDAVGLVQQMEPCDFKTALHLLADHYGVQSDDWRVDLATNSGKLGAPAVHGPRPEGELVLAETVRLNLERRGYHVAAEYQYGSELRKVRFEHQTEQQNHKQRAEKTFRWEHRIADVWYSGDGGVPKSIYVNRAFREREQAGLTVGFEGEAKADLAGNLGFAAFSFKDITREQAAMLADRDVVLWPDNDSSGQRQAAAAAQIIADFGKVGGIRLVEPPAELPPAGDIVDAVQSLNWNQPRIEELIGNAVPFVGENRRGSAGAAARQTTGVSLIDSAASTQQEGPSAQRFTVSDAGVFFLKESATGDPEPALLSARLDVVAETRDSDGSNWGRLLTWRDNEDRQHQWAMPMELLASDAGVVRAYLMGEGLSFITPNARLRERFTEYLQTVPAKQRVLSVSRIGWHLGTYVLPDGAFVPENGQEAFFQTQAEAAHHWKALGTSDAWREHVGQRCAGNSRLVLVVSCGFAGPLLSLVGAESGGIHFFGASSTGKSTALLVGGSVCGGGGQAGFVQTWRTTMNGLEAVAEAHNDGTLFIDELAQVDAYDATTTAYLLANGQGKARMTRTLGGRRSLTWTLLFVSAGELTLAEHAASAGRRAKAGAEVRLLNIPADAGQGFGMFENLHDCSSPQDFVGQLRDAALRYYGAPIRAFLRRLVNEREIAKAMIRSAKETLAGSIPVGADGQVLRAADRFALIAAAGELATAWGLTGWREGEAVEAARRCRRDWLSARGTGGNSDVVAGVHQVRAFLFAHGASRFQPVCGASNGNVEDGEHFTRDRAGFRRLNRQTSETEYLIFPETFRTEVCAGLDHRAVAKELERRGFLLREPPSMTIKPRLPELGTTRVYGIRSAILEDHEC